MKQHILKYLLIALVAIIWGCEPGVDSFTPSNGTADFKKFVAIGDSYTAGYTDGALGRRGQEEGFSSILGKQLMHVGAESYNQPLVKNGGSIGTTVLAPGQNNGYFELKATENGMIPTPTVGDMTIFAEKVYSADNQNFGIPGAKVIHLGQLPEPYPPYSQLNPFYARFASSDDATVIGDALAAQPTFVSLWIGNNDVLGYALAGGEDDAITNPLVFEGALTSIVDAILSTGAKVVIGNIPAIETIPYFNHILKDGHLPLVIVDEDAPGGMRQLIEGEKILLSASTALAMGYGQSADKALPAKYVLDKVELKAISDATEMYNQTIAKIVTEKQLALVDLSALMQEVNTGNGLWIDGNRYSSAFVTGGIFSLDGIHATGKGSAIIANAFIDAINDTYDASVPRANVNDYDAVIFP